MVYILYICAHKNLHVQSSCVAATQAELSHHIDKFKCNGLALTVRVAVVGCPPHRRDQLDKVLILQ